MTSVYDGMAARSADRRQRFLTFELDDLPRLQDVKEPAFLGAYSYTLLATRRRLLRASVCLPLPAGLETPTAAARDYLALTFKRSPKAKSEQIKTIAAGLRVHPAFAIPREFSDGYYIDIRSAYWAILNRVGWNLDYWPGRWLGFGRNCLDFPFPQDKRARTCLVSCAISPISAPYYPADYHRPEGEKIQKPVKNHLINLQLWRLVQDVLFSIGWEAQQAGAIYGYIDGFIAPDYASMARVLEVIGSWGLQARIKQTGRGAVNGRGDYYFGKPRIRFGAQTPYNNIQAKPPHMAFLRERLVKSPYLADCQKAGC